MKKIFILLVLIPTFCLNINSQELNRKKFYMSAAVENTFKLNNWFNDEMYNDAMFSPSTLAFSFRLDWRIYDNWGGIWHHTDLPTFEKQKQFHRI